MKNISHKFQQHTFITVILASTLLGCDGQEDKAPEKNVTIPKVSESKPVAPAATPAPSTQLTTNPTPLPVNQASPTPPPKPAVVLSNDSSGLLNIAIGKMASQSGDYIPTSKAKLAVDGNVDGSFNHGSVSHTTQNPNAWLDIDLGSNEKIDHIVIWNRTDGAQLRLANYWIFISNEPFSPNDTVANIRKSKAVTAIKGEVANPSFATPSAAYKGRYVRIQLDGSAVPNHAYLHVAEVEVFRAK